MPSWKKVILSGSNAALNSLTVTNGATISSSLSLSGSINNVDYIDFNTGSAIPAYKNGRIFWDNTEGALSVYNSEADVTLQVGQENWTRVFNDTGATITNGTPVRITGTHGDHPEVVLAASIQVSGSSNLVNQVLGLATHTIEDQTFGYVTTQGLVRGLNTSAYNDGDTLYVSSSAGQMTSTVPTAPYEIIPVGQVVKASPGGSGIIYVAVQQPLDFTDLSSVYLGGGTYTDGDIWTYNGPQKRWEHKKQLSGSYGLTGSLNINGTALITGSATIGSTIAGASENTITLGARDTANEGGQIGFNAPGGTYTSASFIDNWQNKARILKGNNTTSTGLIAQWDIHTTQLQLPGYTAASSFIGTATANLAVDSGGNVITVSTSGGSVFPYTGTAGVTGSISATGPIYSQVNGGMYFQGGDDAALYDINISNHMGIYGVQDSTVGAIKLGSSGPVLYGSGSKLGIGTTNPSSASLTVNGNVWATSFTGSLLGTSSWATNATLAPLYLPLAGGTMTGDIYAAGRTFQFQDLILGVGTTQGTIKTDGTKYIGMFPTNGVESTRFLANGNVMHGTTFTDAGYRLQVSASSAVSGALRVIGTSVITGSLNVSGGITGSLFGTSSWAVSASWAPTPTTVATASYVSSIAGNISNNVDNYILTATGGSTIQGESNLTFDGTLLGVTGQLTQGDGSAVAAGNYSHAQGDSSEAQGDFSHAEGSTTTAYGGFSHTEGYSTRVGNPNAFLTGPVSGGTFKIDGVYGDMSAIFVAGNPMVLSDINYDNNYEIVTFIIASSTWDGSNVLITLTDDTVSTTTAVVGDLLNIGNWSAYGGDSPIYPTAAHAEGYFVNVLGTNSHAEGNGTITSGEGAHAEGVTTIAGGVYSHAEGESTKAIGFASHAEGDASIASGSYSHAEGKSTQAIGNYSHAEGRTTIASGIYSHAEGRDTQATSNYAHSEGESTQATNLAAHAEGASTKAQGYGSHAEGAATIAVGNYSHAEGGNTLALADVSHTEGLYTTASGNYSHAEGDRTVALGFASHVEGSGSRAQGDYSHAEGYLTVSSGSYSHAEGSSATASGDYSHAEGLLTQAKGEGSHAEGRMTIASGSWSHAEGVGTVSLGGYSHAEGEGTLTRGDGSHTEGWYTLTSGNYSHAEGYFATASGNYSHAEGRYTIASGSYSHAAGSGSYAIGEASYAAGFKTVAVGRGSHAEGSFATASGDFSHAEGYQTIASASFSHVEGRGTITYGGHSHAEGFQTTTRGEFSHAEGSATVAFADYSHAEGQSTTASGSYSHAEGRNTIASGSNSHAEGYFTVALGAASHAEGDTTQALSDYAHAEGRNTVASAKWSHAEGYGTLASGGYSHAEGYFTTASGLHSHAEGLGTVASGSYQHVQGAYNISSSNAAAFIIGNGTSDTSRSNLIFASGSQVQITGSLTVTNGITGSLFGTSSWAVSASFAATASYISGQFFSTFNQPTAATTWSFAHNLANKNPVITVWSDTDEVVVPEKIAGTNSNLATIYFPIPVSGYASATVGSILPTASGSIGSTAITGSLRGEVNALSIASNTASIDLATNNFFTLSLVNGANTHINPSNIKPGQTVNVRVTQGSLGTGTMTFNSAIKSGSLYTGSAVANAVDIMTFISFDSSTLYMSAVTNLK